MKNLASLLFTLVISGCFASYPTTTFWVENKTNKEINFTATAYKIHFETMTVPFLVKPNSKILVRRIGLTETGNVKNVFSDFSFIKPDSISINDAMNPANWEKSKDANGQPIFIFYINPDK